ncbi:hypothetical protein [Flavobacterium sp. GCM10023249]|uniref:hypothetical protein n=1 Tax=unclassified Flavobacterium TaxID=196869 RepID=UPI00361F389E
MNLKTLMYVFSSRKNILLGMLSICGSSSFFAQTSLQNSVIPNSPSTSKLEKILNTEINEFNGTIDLKIPIYDVVYDGVKIPIYLQYDSSGVKVEEIANPTGQSWSLVAGGMISRNQIGTPDDMKYNVGYIPTIITTYNPLYGAMPGQPQYIETVCMAAKTYTDVGWIYSKPKIETVLNWHENGGTLSSELRLFNEGMGNGTNDFAPDYFNIFLPNKKGESFFLSGINQKVSFIENNTTTKVNWLIEDTYNGIKNFLVTDGNGIRYSFKDIEYLRFQRDNAASGSTSGIATKAYTTPIGNNTFLPAGYSFTDAYAAAACTATMTQETFSIMNRLWPKAWHLSEIETLGKSKILFTYENDSQFQLSNTSINRGLYGGTTGGLVSNNKLEKIILPKLTKITWAEGRVEFIYNNLREDTYSKPDQNIISTTKSLDKIKVYDKNNQLIKEIDLSYLYNIAEGYNNNLPTHEHSLYKRLYLNKVSIKKPNSNLVNSEYKFQYNNSLLPYKFSFEQDYWGYFNNNNATSFLPNLWWYESEQRDYIDKGVFSLYPRPVFNGQEKRLADYIGPAADRRPNKDYSKAGILEKVTYPTGGELLLEYEQNKFLYRGTTVDGPGIRIMKTTLKKESNDQIPLITNYKYEENGVTTGRVRELPAFTGLGRYGSASSMSKLYYVSSSPINSFNATYNNNFGYEKVEKQFLNGVYGKEITEFSFPVKLSDTQLVSNGNSIFLSSLNGMKATCTFVSSAYPDPGYTTNLHDYYPYPNETQLGFAFGKILKQSIFDSNGMKKYEKINDYTFGNNNVITKAYYVQPGEGYTTLRYLSSSYILKKTEEFFTENNNTLNLKEEFSYDNNGLLLQQKKTDSKGDVYQTNYDYPNSPMFQLNQPIVDLKSLNILNNPIITSNFRNNWLLSKTYNEYESLNNSQLGIDNPITLKKVYQLEINKPINDFQNFNWTNAQLPDFNTMDSRMKLKKHVHKNDINTGKILEFSEKGGNHICYIWGYNKSKVIAEIENIEFTSIPQTTITNLQALSDADNDNCRNNNCKEQLLRKALSDLRASMPNAMVKTYTYDPLVGVTSMTDARNNTTFYVYDDFQRLKEVRDNNGNILSENEYYYKK